MPKTKKVQAPWLKSYKKIKKNCKYPTGSMYDALMKACEQWPDNMAYNYFGTKVSYSEFLAIVEDAARGFVSLGAKKGETISVCAPNTPEAIAAIYAINKIGCVASVFHPLSAPNEIRDNLNLVGSNLFVAIDVAWENIKPILAETKVERTIIISAADSLPMIPKIGYKVLKVKELQKELVNILTKNEGTMNWDEFLGAGRYVVGAAHEKMDVDDVAIILYSGGTTGKSKGIALSNLSFNACAKQAKTFFSDVVVPGATMLGILPIFHGFGLGVGVHTSLTNGMGVILVPKFDASKFDRLLAENKPNLIIGVPSLFEAMLKNKKIRKMDLSFIHVLMSGGDSLSPKLKHEVDEFLSKNGARTKLLQGYGLTESLACVCANPLHMQRDGAIGIPFPDMYMKVVEPNSPITKKPGEIGEVVISGPTLMKGYLNNVKETNETLQMHDDGRIWLHTGDMGYMDKDGWIYFASRLKRMIISNGYNIYPNEVETAILSVPEVLIATVVGVDDKARGQIAKAFVVLKEGEKPSEEIREKIHEACKMNLAKYKWPRQIEFRATLPKTKLNKIAYRDLQDESNKK